MTIWDGGSDLTLPARNVLSEEKVPKSRWRRGPRGSPQITKSAQNKYLGKVKKFQNNRLSHFLGNACFFHVGLIILRSLLKSDFRINICSLWRIQAMCIVAVSSQIYWRRQQNIRIIARWVVIGNFHLYRSLTNIQLGNKNYKILTKYCINVFQNSYTQDCWDLRITLFFTFRSIFGVSKVANASEHFLIIHNVRLVVKK